MKIDKQQEAQAAAGDSISSVNVSVKDYTPSEVFPHEPLPAYKKSRATPVQIARIAAYTVIACSTILGLCMIASSYIEANASCSQLMHAEALLRQQVEEIDRPSYQALVDPLQSDESSDSKQESVAAAPLSHKEQHGNVVPPSATTQAPTQNSNSDAETQTIPIHIKLPLDFDDIAASLMEKNQRSRMNCVVEKKRAEEVMDHQPKTVRLPFGVNITTDPRYEHVTGERMVIYCESNQDQRNLPMEPMASQSASPMVFPVPMMMQSNQASPPQISHLNPFALSMLAARAAQEEQSMAQQQQQPQQSDDGPITIIAREEHVIPVFQQFVPEMRSMNQENLENRNMGEKMLYHPGVPSGRMLALADPKGNPMMQEFRQLQNSIAPEMRHPQGPMAQEMRHAPTHHIPAIPSDMVRPPPPPAFHKIPIHVPTILQQAESQNQQVSDNGIEEDVEDSRPHFVQPRSVRGMQNAYEERRY